MRRQEEVALFGNLTAMIDVVFQIIIFFVCTAKLQDSALDTRIRLAMAPHGEAVAKKDPLEIVVDVSAGGDISIARTRITQPILASILTKAVREYGHDVPVTIRGDSHSTHTMIRTVMDTCAGSGIWKIKIAAMKEKGG
jgi:biopolymer transport protein ExbD